MQPYGPSAVERTGRTYSDRRAFLLFFASGLASQAVAWNVYLAARGSKRQILLWAMEGKQEFRPLATVRYSRYGGSADRTKGCSRPHPRGSNRRPELCREARSPFSDSAQLARARFALRTAPAAHQALQNSWPCLLCSAEARPLPILHRLAPRVPVHRELLRT